MLKGQGRHGTCLCVVCWVCCGRYWLKQSFVLLWSEMVLLTGNSHCLWLLSDVTHSSSPFLRSLLGLNWDVIYDSYNLTFSVTGYRLTSDPGKWSRSQRMWLCGCFLCCRYVHVHVPVRAHVCVFMYICVCICTCVFMTYVYACVKYRGQHLVSSRNMFLRGHLPYFGGTGFLPGT